MLTSLTRLYLITPPAIPDLPAFVRQAEEAFSGGDVACLQLRLKDAPDGEILKAAEALIPLTRAHSAAFILNDRPDLAARTGADGVHLGQDDLERWPLAKTREIIGEEWVIGVSAHASMHLAMEAGEAGADYLAFGAFYPTRSKPMEKLLKYGTPTPDLLTRWAETALLPSVAIGGITPANAAPLIRAGADFIAVITAVWEHPEGPKAAVKAFNEVLGSNAPEPGL